jgi:lipoprotein-releasing system ATP-binding protein
VPEPTPKQAADQKNSGQAARQLLTSAIKALPLNSSEPLIDAAGITKEFGQEIKTKILFGIDLKVYAGEFVSMIGVSGSGKSTLLYILGALDRPTSGKLIIDGTDLSLLNDDQLAFFRNKTIGFIFQSHFLLPEFSVLENILIPHLIYSGKVQPEIKKRALRLLDWVGLSHRQDSRANAISGGEQQRVAIARSLINNPRLILADEPTGNLDSANTEKAFQLLQCINREYKTTFIIVTHNPDLAQRTDRLLELKDGLIIRDQQKMFN